MEYKIITKITIPHGIATANVMTNAIVSSAVMTAFLGSSNENSGRNDYNNGNEDIEKIVHDIRR